MNEVLEQLYARKSVRAFEDREISKEDKRTILEAAIMAPSAGNQQLYTILDITDPDKRVRLSQTCDNQPFIAKARMVLIFCADCQKWRDAFEAADCEPRRPGAGDLLLAIEDAVIAAQNAVTAAWSLGIGSCYIGDIMENCEIHRKLLGLPEYVFPAAMLVFGYPTKQQAERKKPERAELGYIVHENTYRHMEPEELQRMFDKQTGEKEYRDWMQAFCRRKYNSDFSREMTRSARAYLKEFEEHPAGAGDCSQPPLLSR
ncbi:MAG: nitroreductase family protein [Lachnospiraceae bacterium]|nr:nitroreductase family protein [Lachnospiraceae bacterium]